VTVGRERLRGVPAQARHHLPADQNLEGIERPRSRHQTRPYRPRLQHGTGSGVRVRRVRSSDHPASPRCRLGEERLAGLVGPRGGAEGSGSTCPATRRVTAVLRPYRRGPPRCRGCRSRGAPRCRVCWRAGVLHRRHVRARCRIADRLTILRAACALLTQWAYPAVGAGAFGAEREHGTPPDDADLKAVPAASRLPERSLPAAGGFPFATRSVAYRTGGRYCGPRSVPSDAAWPRRCTRIRLC
jgi:hypothetical protein